MKKRSTPWRLAGHQIVYRLVMAYCRLSKAIPLKSWILMGKYLGFIVCFFDRHHRRIAERNLHFALGEVSASKKYGNTRSLVRHNFGQFGMIGQEWIKLKDSGPEALKRIIKVEGREHLIAAKNKSRSIILLGAHFGNWEYAHAYYSSFINPLTFIVRPIDNPYFEKERVAMNRRFGVTTLYKDSGLRGGIKNLKAGEDLVIFADRKETVKQTIPCRFFDKETSTMTLVPALARKYHVPVVPMFIVRCEDLVHHRLLFFPELSVEHDKDKKQGIDEATQIQSDIIEKIIREYPDHWVWFHKRWRRYHPYLYPKDMAKRLRRKARKRALLNQINGN